jgi:hypothetical protein
MGGYDSHYALVRQISGLVFVPAKPGEAPEYDELVVFKTAQVLPRYIFYYRSVSAPASNTAALLYTLWLESSPAPSTLRMLAVLREKHSLVRLIEIGSVDELSAWLNSHPEALDRPLRVVCGTDVTADASHSVLATLRNKKVNKTAILFTQAAPPNIPTNGKTILSSRDPMRAAEFSIHGWPATEEE